MTIRGKSALRKKRFTVVSYAQGSREDSSFGRAPILSSGPFWHQVVAEHTDVGQVPVALREVQPVADHEAVRNLEADPAHGHIDLAAGRLGQERADLQRGRLARLQVANQVRERQARVDDVLDDEDVAALDVDGQVL